MLRLVCLSLFALASAFPFENALRERNEFGNFNVQLVEFGELLRQRHSFCLQTPFLRKICLPTALQFFLPLQTMGAGGQRCLKVPLMRAYVVKVCPSRETILKGENSGRSSKEIIEEITAEAETERLSDNTNSEVNGGGTEPEYIVKEESSVGTKELKVKDKSAQTKNNIFRFSEETGVSGVKDFQNEQPIYDENNSITSNYV